MTPLVYSLICTQIALGQAISLGTQEQVANHGNLALRHEKHMRTIEVPVYNRLDKQHLEIKVTVGTPPQKFSIMPDTGSPFTWVPSAASPACAPNCPLPVWNLNASSTAVDIHAVFNASYGLTPDNIMLGEFYNDTLGIGGVALPQFPVALVNVIDTIYDAQIWGIVGLGSQLQNRNVPGSVILWENLYKLGHIGKRLFSVWLNHQDAKKGTILFGGVDKSKAHGALKSTPLTSVVQTPHGDDFTEWSVNLTSLTRRVDQAGSEEPLLRTTYNAIVDTGSPNMYVPQYLYDTLAAPLNVTLRTYRNTSYVPCSLRSWSGSLHFTFAGKDGAPGPQVRVPYSEIIYPFGMPANLGEVRSEEGTALCYLGVLSNNGSGIFLLGNSFIRSAYVVYDADNLELRMAQSRWA
ncbi:acid protease [Karstenula rhodostoma CBS 690.94]|uniref:Acid protease n=1 Tax=Karstenula rhodostoma CBS 690.94 TaxID=1392251 RepID=A0A9P4PDM4_9PLEO|nr:acid protease [Karstenula rhodostoma CBS 690.94]